MMCILYNFEDEVNVPWNFCNGKSIFFLIIYLTQCYGSIIYINLFSFNRLTVTDTDGAINSTITNITVLQVPDYPPEANAGSSIVLYLPRNNVTLNGNLSSDDKGIASWEWTKSPGDQDKAVDMQVIYL